jgi:hypothetical protein
LATTRTAIGSGARASTSPSSVLRWISRGARGRAGRLSRALAGASSVLSDRPGRWCARMMASFHIGLRVGLRLWLTWLQIASDHAGSAEQERSRGLELARTGADPRPARAREMQNAMVAISASAHAVDGLYGEVKPLIPVPRDVVEAWEAQRTPRHRQVFETIKGGCRLGRRTNEWPGQFKDLYDTRDDLVHHGLRLRPAVPHPGDPTTHVSQEMADYTLESARRAVDLACDVALTTLRQPTAPQLVRWARSLAHMPATVEALQAVSRSGDA